MKWINMRCVSGSGTQLNSGEDCSALYDKTSRQERNIVETIVVTEKCDSFYV